MVCQNEAVNEVGKFVERFFVSLCKGEVSVTPKGTPT